MRSLLAYLSVILLFLTSAGAHADDIDYSAMIAALVSTPNGLTALKSIHDAETTGAFICYPGGGSLEFKSMDVTADEENDGISKFKAYFVCRPDDDDFRSESEKAIVFKSADSYNPFDFEVIDNK